MSFKHFSDGWKELPCGLSVLFRGCVPLEVSSYPENLTELADLERDMAALGFHEFDIDPNWYFIEFIPAINRHLTRLKLCPESCQTGGGLCIDTHENGYDVVLYDHEEKLDISPVSLLNFLRSIRACDSVESLWSNLIDHLSNKRPVDAIKQTMEKALAGDYSDFGLQVGRDVIDLTKISKTNQLLSRLGDTQAELLLRFTDYDVATLISVANKIG